MQNPVQMYIRRQFLSNFLYQCKRFLQQDITNRIKTVKSLHLCLNCLKRGHFVENCKSTKCKTCQKSHNTLLHLTRNNASETPTPETERKSVESNTNVPQSSIIMQCFAR